MRPSPRVISGRLPLVQRRLVFAWAQLNETALGDYWAGAIGTLDFARRLRPLPIIEGSPGEELPPERLADGVGSTGTRRHPMTLGPEDGT